MKSPILITFFLLLFCGNIFAQPNKLLLFESHGEKDSIFFKVGDNLKAWLINGKEFQGNITSIEQNYFILGTDTIQTGQVRQIGYKRSNRKGNTMIIVGTSLIAGSGIAFLIGYIVNSGGNGGIEELIIAVPVCILAVPIIIAGIVSNKAKFSVKKEMGTNWHLKAV